MVERVPRPFRHLHRMHRRVWMELQRVVWPSHEETYAFTGVVLVAVAVVAAWIGFLDIIFTNIVGALRLYAK